MSGDAKLSEAEPLHEELARLVHEYRNAPDDGPVREEAWNWIADFTEANAEQIIGALAIATAGRQSLGGSNGE